MFRYTKSAKKAKLPSPEFTYLVIKLSVAAYNHYIEGELATTPRDAITLVYMHAYDGVSLCFK